MKLRLGEQLYHLYHSQERLYVNHREVLCLCHHDYRNIYLSPLASPALGKQIVSHIAALILAKKQDFSHSSSITSQLSPSTLLIHPTTAISSDTPPTTQPSTYTQLADRIASLLATTEEFNLPLCFHRTLAMLAKELDLSMAMFTTPNLQPLYCSSHLRHFPHKLNQLAAPPVCLGDHFIYYNNPIALSLSNSREHPHPEYTILSVADLAHLRQRGRLILYAQSPIPTSRPALHLYLTIANLIASLLPPPIRSAITQSQYEPPHSDQPHKPLALFHAPPSFSTLPDSTPNSPPDSSQHLRPRYQPDYTPHHPKNQHAISLPILPPTPSTTTSPPDKH